MQPSAPANDDWTERYRPTCEADLVGNTASRKQIVSWINSWENKVPKKKGLLLVGPPGVGKTTIARAMALERGWEVIELNASEARNAAAIRKAATFGAIHGTLFPTESTDKRTLILLDEVDHMSGKLARMSEKRIEGAFSTGDDARIEKLRGDTGGKAELLNLLEITTHPVILACNDLMRFWGLGAGWKERRDRFLRRLELVHFKRATNTDMRKVATRLLAAENRSIAGDALERLLISNAGDIRALIRDIQCMAAGTTGELTMSEIDSQIAIGGRDGTLDLFPGLEKLYRARSANEAYSTMLQIDKDPDELIAWISWNNPSVHTASETISMKARRLRKSDGALPIRFTNRAYRSWYWSAHLSSISAGVLPPSASDRKLFINYPGFLRRGREAWRKAGIIEKLSIKANCSRAAARNELYPLVRAIHDNNIDAKWPTEFNVSKKCGFDADEHILLTGLNPVSASSKRLAERFKEVIETPEVVEAELEEISDEYSSSDLPDGQATLF